MKRISCIISLLLLAVSLFAAQVTGKVVDFGTKQAIDFANVSVIKPSEVSQVGPASEQLVTGTITDATGAFTLELADGKYTIVVSFMGYSEQRKEITVSGKPLNLGRIQLKEDAQALSEVEVVGQGSSMRFELDKKVFTVDQNIASAGASVTDVLENIPSVDVDQEGTISLRNSEDVEIWINGKPAGLNSENRGQVLQQMPAGTIEKIEIITNPSAKFSPEGTSGIINLVMKKDRSAGYYGSVQAGLDYALAAPWNVPPGANIGFNINFNAGPVDGYFNLGYRYHISNGGSKTDRYNLSGAGAQQLDSSLIQSHLLQEGTQTNRGGGLFARAGLNFRLAEGHTLGVSGFGMVSEPNVFKMSNTNHRTYLLTAPDGTVMRDYTRDQSGTGSHPGGNATIDYTFELDNHKLYVSGTYNNFGFNMATDYSQANRDLNTNLYDTTYQEQTSLSKDQSIEVKADYEWKPTTQSRLEAGYDYTRSWNNSSADAHNNDKQGAHIKELFPYYADFNGLTQNHALYITYGNRFFDRLSIQVGLRGEYYMRHLESSYKDNSGTIQDSYASFPNKKDTAYFQIYPSAYISYDFGNGHELQLNYTRRVNRPWGHQINPRMDFSDSTNISYGNVDLLPAFSNNLELNYLKTWDRHTLSAGVFWKYQEGSFQNYKYMDGDVMKNTYFNIGTRQDLGVEIVAKNRLFGEVLQLTTSANFYWNNVSAVNQDLVHQGNTIHMSLPAQNIFAGSVRINAQFLFTKNFSGQISARYRSPRVVAQGTTSHSYSIDVGLRHTFLNKKLALALNVRDLLDSRSRRNTTWGDGFWQFSENRWHSRTISLTLTYNFGNQSGKRRSDRGDNMSGSSDDYDDSGNSNMDY
ncbi:MAG: TonB-dependent receptor [Paludibacteraceae bacterium]|nr:TonB-dependent receptor [Paludibacteraceae bacterium]